MSGCVYVNLQGKHPRLVFPIFCTLLWSTDTNRLLDNIGLESHSFWQLLGFLFVSTLYPTCYCILISVLPLCHAYTNMEGKTVLAFYSLCNSNGCAKWIFLHFFGSPNEWMGKYRGRWVKHGYVSPWKVRGPWDLYRLPPEAVRSSFLMSVICNALL